MHLFRMRPFRLLALTLIILTTVGLRAQAPQFWMSGIPVNWMNSQLHEPSNDFMQAFEPNAPWKQGEAKVTVFKIPTQLISFGTDEQVRTVFDYARARHWKMAIEFSVVTKLEACGDGEGYVKPGLATRIAGRVKSLGLNLDYIAMDGPVWLGHEKTWGTAGKGAANCAYPLPKVAKLVGMTIAEFQKSFPDIQVGEIDSINPDRLPIQKVVADYVEFVRLLQQETGLKMAFFHADTVWNSKASWQDMFALTKREMHKVGVPVGVIIGGDADSKTAPAWTKQGLNNLALMLRSPATTPDQIIDQSWQTFPTKMLPENEPGTSTWLLLQSERLLAR